MPRTRPASAERVLDERALNRALLARQFLLENADVAEEVEARIRAALELPGGLRSADEGSLEVAADD